LFFKDVLESGTEEDIDILVLSLLEATMGRVTADMIGDSARL